MPSLDELTYGGERVTHLYPNDCYFAHLSVYHFALPFASGKIVLDAGCGSGYGANYLAQRGATMVHAIDASDTAVQFCRSAFRDPNLAFEQKSLERLTGFHDGYFDLIFSSNTLEHVYGIPDFLRSARTILKPDGALIVAVPPITNDEAKALDLTNPYHLNSWSPRQWHSVFSLYFEDVQTYRHSFDKPGVQLDFSNTPEQTTISERDFTFHAVPVSALYELPTLSALFVIRHPKPPEYVPASGVSLNFVENSFTRAPSASEGPTPPAPNLALLRKSIDVLVTKGPRQLARDVFRFYRWQLNRRHN